jgi:hypothetical protein
MDYIKNDYTILSSDPSDLYIIRDLKIVDKISQHLEVFNYSREIQTLKITGLNKDLGIYTWEILSTDGKLKNKFLMQNTAFSKRLPIIVCDCGSVKCVMEFKFDNFK